MSISPISDPWVDVTGLLEGGRLRRQWTRVPLTQALTEVEHECVEHFRVRAREFLSNIAELRQGVKRQMSLARDRGVGRAQVSDYPGRHRVKSLYLDFRHFVAEQEPGKFSFIRNLVRKRVTDETLCAFLDHLQEQFLPPNDDALDFMGAKLTTREFIDVWFNTEFFHRDRQAKYQVRQTLLKTLEESGAAHLLYWSVSNTAHPIKCLYACVKDLASGNEFANCPDRRIVMT